MRHALVLLAFIIFFADLKPAFGQLAWDEIMLPVGTVFDQGNTEWCWAYSAFHTLRTYYVNLNTTSADATVTAWRNALQPLNTAEAFRSFMSDHFSTGRTGDPQDLVDLLIREKSLPDPKWKVYYPNGRQSAREARRANSGVPERLPTERLSASEILQKVHDGLKRQIPTSFCNSSHCTTIYGDDFEGNTPTAFAIADSNGGDTYKRDFNYVKDELDMIMTLE